MNYIQILAAAFLIFASGGATGYFYAKNQQTDPIPAQTKLTSGGRAPWMGRDPLRYFVRFLEDKINISEAQKEQINTIIEESNLSMKKIWDDVRPKASEQMAQTNEKIKAVLTPEQVEKFDTLMEEFRNKRFKGRGPRRQPDGEGSGRMERGGPHEHRSPDHEGPRHRQFGPNGGGRSEQGDGQRPPFNRPPPPPQQ